MMGEKKRNEAGEIMEDQIISPDEKVGEISDELAGMVSGGVQLREHALIS